MNALPPDPLESCGIVELGNKIRCGETTAEEVTRAYLQRISALNPKLDAFVHVAEETALAAAQGVDRMLNGGIDLGPLMGIPVAVKDLLAVEGMPAKAGSRLKVDDLIGSEGRFVKTLKRAGCIILGKTRTTEFAAGAQHISHPTPWNPWDSMTHRTPGGSSSGSAVAQAAGLCSFAIGSDTGGSVRLPAALCGVFGLKTTVGLWPLDGVFPLSPTMDTLGIFTNSAADAALVFEALTGEPILSVTSLKGLRTGKSEQYFFDDLDHDVEFCIENTLSQIADKGVDFIRVEFPESIEVGEIFSKMVPADLLATLGQEHFLESRENIDPVVIDRVSQALDLKAIDYIRLRKQQKELENIGRNRMKDLDTWISPTTKTLLIPIAECSSIEKATDFISRALNLTRFGNVYGFCASTIPLYDCGADFPVGLQLHCGPNEDAKLLSISVAFEQLLGTAPKPDVADFL